MTLNPRAEFSVPVNIWIDGGVDNQEIPVGAVWVDERKRDIVGTLTSTRNLISPKDGRIEWG